MCTLHCLFSYQEDILWKRIDNMSVLTVYVCVMPKRCGKRENDGDISWIVIITLQCRNGLQIKLRTISFPSDTKTRVFAHRAFSNSMLPFRNIVQGSYQFVMWGSSPSTYFLIDAFPKLRFRLSGQFGLLLFGLVLCVRRWNPVIFQRLTRCVRS